MYISIVVMKLTIAILLIIFSAFVISTISHAQNQAYLFSYQIDSILAIDSTPYKYQTAAWNYSFIGEHKLAMEYKDKQFPLAKKSEPKKEEVLLFSKYHATPAMETILREAAKTKVIIFNEVHHLGMHRAYLTSLLNDLYKLGYKHIGMEGLKLGDSLLNRRKYPIQTTGFYVKESSFGNLIRESIATGMNVFAYEQNPFDSLQGAIGREKSQALNIRKVMDTYPNDKFIIYCGYDHAAEDTLKNFMGLPMAGQLKNMMGIDPFTIDQTSLSEFYKVGSRYRSLINIDYDAMFMDSLGNYFNKSIYPKAIDCCIFHPNTTYIKGRPNWILQKGKKLKYVSGNIHLPYPYLLKIYNISDNIDEAVPIDIIEIKSKMDKKASLLQRKQKHIAVAESVNGSKQIVYLK